MPGQKQSFQLPIRRNDTFVQRAARCFRQPERQRQLVSGFKVFAVAFCQIRKLVHDADHGAVYSLGVLDFIHLGKFVVDELLGHTVSNQNTSQMLRKVRCQVFRRSQWHQYGSSIISLTSRATCGYRIRTDSYQLPSTVVMPRCQNSCRRHSFHSQENKITYTETTWRARYWINGQVV